MSSFEIQQEGFRSDIRKHFLLVGKVKHQLQKTALSALQEPLDTEGKLRHGWCGDEVGHSSGLTRGQV